jgi:hypothetical protein
MELVTDGERRYVVLKQAAESSLVRSLDTDEAEYVPNERLSTVAGEPPLSAAAAAVPTAVRAILTATHTEEGLGLLVELDDRGAVPVRQLLGYGLCESALHGLLAEFTMAGLIQETEVLGERGYELTGVGRDGLDRLRADQRTTD